MTFPLGDTYFVNSFDEFKSILREHELHTGTRFVYDKGNKLFTETDIRLTTDLRLHWLEDTPFFHFGRRVYACHQGKDKNISTKKKYHRLQEEKALFAPVKRYKKKKQSIKIDCPARVSIIRIYRMPEYKVPSLHKKYKIKICSIIKTKIRNEEHVVGEEGYLFNIPNVQDHLNHSLGEITLVHEHIEAAANEHLQALEYKTIVKPEPLDSDEIEDNIVHINEIECLEYTSEHLEAVYDNVEIIQTDMNEHLEAAYAVVELTESAANEHLEAAVAVAELTESVANEQLNVVYEFAESTKTEHLDAAAVSVAELTEAVTDEHMEAAGSVVELTGTIPDEHLEAAVAVAELTESVPSKEQSSQYIGRQQVLPCQSGSIFQRNAKRQLINDCKATMQSIQSLIWNLEENQLGILSNSLKQMREVVCAQVTANKSEEQVQFSISGDTYVLST